MNLVVRRCRDCGQPLPPREPHRVLCDACRKQKLEEKKERVRSLNLGLTRSPRTPRKARRRCKSIAQCVREAEALGLSYGRYVGRDLDRL